ncbi:MAG: hypothetical protein JWO67_3542 [Streptosporangiaceae bacterium]|nr:hypothetical protein [Streptosporangiaceae bacterium]
MPHIRKALAGNDSFGNEWPEDGAVVEVPENQADALMLIPDGGFSEASAPKVTPKKNEGDDSGSSGGDSTGGPGNEAEKDPPADAESKTEINEAPKLARRGRPPKKTVEE